MGWIAGIMQGVGTVNEMTDNARSTQLAVEEAKDNKSMALDAAADAVARGNREAALVRLQGSRLAGQQRVAYAASGVDATSGTPVDVMADSRLVSEMDAQQLQNNAAREAWGFRRHGLKYGQQAALEAARGSARQSATALSGASRVASSIASEYERGGWGQ